jgi:hypothetical protein
MQSRTSCILAVGMIAIGTSCASAQWIDDPAVNLSIANAASEQVQSKIVTTSDGGCYIGWFDNRSGGYDVYLQRLDVFGFPQWGDDGILIADRGFSSTQDWDLAVDKADHALLAFRDDRSGGTQVTATRVSPAGVQVWGNSGVQMTSGSAFYAAPKICATSDEFIVVGWSQDSSYALEKLDATGALVWPSTVVQTPDSGNWSLSDLMATTKGYVAALIVEYGSFSDPRHLIAQKHGTDGSLLWDAVPGGDPDPVVVFDGGSLQFGNFPVGQHDGTGGLAVAWYSSSPSLECFAQRIDSDGDEMFPHNGVTVATNAENRVSPVAHYDPTNESIYVLWTKTNGSQSQDGLNVQRIDNTGARQWSDLGTEILPLGTDSISQLQMTSFPDDGVLITFMQSGAFGQDVYKATRLCRCGDLIWDPQIIDLSSMPAQRSRLFMTQNLYGTAICSWTQDGDLYAQNIRPDALLGLRPADADGDFVLGVPDFFSLLQHWGACATPPSFCPWDAAPEGGDGLVNVDDFFYLLQNWGG